MKQFYLLFIVFIFLQIGFSKAQSNPPVAIGEEVMPVFNIDNFQADTTTQVNLLLNDFDPDGDPIEIAEVKNRAGQEFVALTFNDSILSLTMIQSHVEEQAYEYRVREINDTSSVSNWATLVFNPKYSEDYPVAKNDTFTIYRGDTVYYDVLENDYHPLNDTLILHSMLPGDSIIEVFYRVYENQDFLRYIYYVSDTTPWVLNRDRGIIYIHLANNQWYDSLNLNNINARFNCHGSNFWDMDYSAKFKVPNGSNVSSLFCQAFWIGGLDENDQLHLAGDRYRQIGTDYWPGPVTDVVDSAYESKWYHVWKLNRSEIEYHKNHWWEPDYEPLSDILTWPGNGYPEHGQSERIAPFEDHNNNGNYEPMLGDAPIIKGDQAVFYVFNDNQKVHTETEGISLGAEIRLMAYAFDMPEDSVLWNTIFLNFEIVNRSDTSYHNVYAGLFTDTDLGYAWNDRIQCDVERGMYFVYNGTENDLGPPENPGYGEHPPSQGILFLGGPYMDPDGIDNPKYDLLGNQIVDESINGLNFGDGIIDNERFGMTNFLYFNGGGSAISDPVGANEYYNFLQSIWKDDSKLQYGGAGHPFSGSVGPDCNFFMPADSDPYNWGTYGLWPNAGFNQNGLYWTEEELGWNAGDRRGMGSMGPFTLAAGQTQVIDIALPWARDYDGTAWSSALLLKERADYLINKFRTDPDFFSDIEVLTPSVKEIVAHPNPVNTRLYVLLSSPNQKVNYIIYDILGNQELDGESPNASKSLSIDVSNLNPGHYILKVFDDLNIYTSRFIKL